MKKKYLNNLKNINIDKELKKSYLDYAMSVIIGRALPDIRDGLKPVHRRILYAMYILKNNFDKPYKKSARIVGDVIGKYHPHGDNAVYESIVRMAQNFSLRYPLIDGQGNFGSIDGDSAAAMRYTEIRMSKIALELLKDIEKNTVTFLPNYDATETIPEILPSKIPNILINGATGIAVGMATNIPPHNITEIVNALIKFIENKKISTKNLMKYIKGPDFPTGGIIENNKGIYKAYKTGKGTIKIKAKINFETDIKSNKKLIVIQELPYQSNKIKIIEKIIELIKNKKIEEISNIRDESNKEGIRIIIEIKKDIKRNFLVNKLLYLTNLKISYGINIVAIYNGKPKKFNLKKIFNIFINHRKKIIKNKTIFKLNKIKKRIHILKGLILSSLYIDKIINIIKNSKKINEAKKKIKKIKFILEKNNKLIKFKKKNYKLSKKQISSLLKLNLSKLTHIEQNKIKKEFLILKKKKDKLKNILINKKILINIIKKEFIYIKEKYGDKRITKINKKYEKIKTKDLITKEKIILILNKFNYLTYKKISKYNIQHKGGKGKKIVKTKKNNFIQKTLITNTKSIIFLFTNKGRFFKIKIYQLIKQNNIINKLITNLIKLKENEKITCLIKDKKKYEYFIIITYKGLIKKIKIKKFKKNGINITNLKKKDNIINVNLLNNSKDIMLFTKLGKAIRFKTKLIRETSRTSSGVKAIKLNKKDKIVSSLIPYKKKEILIVTEKGYGKRTLLNEFLTKSRAIKGIKYIKNNSKNGNVVKVIQISINDQILVITNQNNIIRILVKEIKILKRNTQGIIIIRLKKSEKVIDVQKI